MAKKKKDKREQHDAEVQVPSAAGMQETETGPPPKMKRKGYERQMRILHGAHQDITLPKRQPPRGYLQPDLPLRHIPAPF